LIVLFVVIVVKEALFRFALHESRIVDSTAVRSDAWHHRSDAITSSAAGLGITIALVGGEGFEAADGIAAMFASGIIFWNGWRLMRPALDDLMDASAKPELIADIRRAAETVPKTGRVDKCLVRRMGAQLLVDMHLQVKPDMTVMEAHQVAHAVKDVVRQEHPRVLDVLVHAESLEELVAVRSESLEESGHG
jgi:cation diffusion facilitator family transporter